MHNVYVALWFNLRDLPGCHQLAGPPSYQVPLRGPMGEPGFRVEHPDWRTRISLVFGLEEVKTCFG